MPSLASVVVVAVLVLSAVGAPPALGGTPVVAGAGCAKFSETNIEGWAVDFAFGPQNRLWLTENFSPAQLRGVSPGGGADVTLGLGRAGSTNRIADPQGITAGVDGRLWITGLADQKLGAVDPVTGSLSTWALGGGPARIATDPSGLMWVTLSTANQIAQIDTSGSVLARYDLAPGAAPWDIAVGRDGIVWFTEPGTHSIGRLTTSGPLAEYVVGGNPHDLALGTSGDLWYTNPAQSTIGHMTLAGVSLADTNTPSLNSGPEGIAFGPDGAVWFTEHNTSRIGRLDPAGPVNTINETIITTSSQPPGPIIALPGTADGTIWFGIQAPHLEHFKPNLDGTVGLLPPSVMLMAGSPMQTTSTGPVYSTSTPFTIAATTPDQCLDSTSYRFYALGATPGPFGPAPASFTLGNGTWIVEFYGTGPGGDGLPQPVTIFVDSARFAGDTLPPVLSLPANISVFATGVDGATVTYTATASDPPNGAVPITCTPPSGSVFAIAVTPVRCIATDATGNFLSGSFSVTVVAGPPIVTVPKDRVVLGTAPTTSVTFAAAALSPWGGSVGVTCTPPGSLQPSPASFTTDFTANVVTAVTCTSAVDGRGQSGSASFTVLPVTPPVLQVPVDITRIVAGTSAVVTYSVTASSVLDGPITPTCVPPSGSTFPLGTIVVTCMATDAHGFSTTRTFKVTIANTQPSTLRITSLPVLRQGAVTVSATLLGPGGTPIVGRTVSFSAGGLTVSGISNAHGVATAALGLKKGLYTLTAAFAGDASYLASTTTAPLAVLPKGGDEDKGEKDKGSKDDPRKGSDRGRE